jgi:catalase
LRYRLVRKQRAGSSDIRSLVQTRPRPVVGRFALAGGMPFQPDAPNTVRSMALRFVPPGERNGAGMNNIPVFPVNRRAADEQCSPSVRSGDRQADPAKVKAFLAAHPEAARALALIKKRQVTRFRKLH